jgi:hypothetical protein
MAGAFGAPLGSPWGSTSAQSRSRVCFLGGRDQAVQRPPEGGIRCAQVPKGRPRSRWRTYPSSAPPRFPSSEARRLQRVLEPSERGENLSTTASSRCSPRRARSIRSVSLVCGFIGFIRSNLHRTSPPGCQDLPPDPRGHRAHRNGRREPRGAAAVGVQVLRRGAPHRQPDHLRACSPAGTSTTSRYDPDGSGTEPRPSSLVSCCAALIRGPRP